MSIQLSQQLEKFLQLRSLAYTNVVLGVASFTLQLTLLIGYKNDYSKHYRAGVWIGLLLLSTGFVSLASLRKRSNRWNLFLLLLAISSIVNGIVLMIVASIAIRAWYWVTWYWFEVTVIRCLNAVLVVCGLAAVPVNMLLSVVVYRIIQSHRLQLP